MNYKNIKYPQLKFLSVVLLISCSLVAVGAINVSQAFGLVFLGQLALLARSPQRAACLMAALTAEQIDEFKEIVSEIGEDWGDIKQLPSRVKDLEKRNDELSGELKKHRRLSAGGIGNTGTRWVGNVPFIAEEPSEALTAHMVLMLSKQENGLSQMVADPHARQRILDKAKSIGGIQTRTALDSTTTPLPTVYTPAIVELVWKYGQARQFATVFPLGAGTVKLPRLKAGEDTFGYLGAGTAGMSQAVPEKRVTAELVTFTANKAGGIIRIPTELEEDTFIPIGQFLARYIARQLAKLEDSTLFLADGSGTYANITGIGPYCAANATYLQQLAGGKTKPTDASLSDFRSMRARVNAAVYQDEPAYYMHPSMEALLVTFNTIGSPLIYRPASGGQPATLDGFPIRWCGILPAYSTLATANAYIAFYGALTYWYLGERVTPRIEISRDVFFATDELAMRALERIDVEAMAIDAMSALQTAAA